MGQYGVVILASLSAYEVKWGHHAGSLYQKPQAFARNTARNILQKYLPMCWFPSGSSVPDQLKDQNPLQF